MSAAPRERACLCSDTPTAAGILRTFARTKSVLPVKILMLSWEYPPVVIGGLGRHVHHLSTALAAAGHDVVVLSRRPTGHGSRPPTRRPTTSARACG